MKKLLMLPISLALCLTLITGCGSQTGSPSEVQPTETSEAESQVSGEETQEEEDSSKEKEGLVSEETADISDTTDTAVRVMALKGPTAMGLVELMDESESGAVNGNDYEFTIAASADEVTPKLVQGEADIAAVPANLASVLYNNTEGQVQVLAINTLGVLYIVDTGDTVHSAADLKGKTIYASGKGATPEYAIDYILMKNGIDPEKDVTIEWKSEHAECVAALAASEDGGIALLPQPFVTIAQTQDDRIRIALDLTEEWDKLQKDEETPSALLTGVVVARTDFIEEHPEAISAFMDSYKKSVDYVNGNMEEAAKLIEKFDIVPAAVAQKALPYCNITFIEGAEMKDKLSGYLSVLLEQNEKSVGGEIPADDFYYERQGK